MNDPGFGRYTERSRRVLALAEAEAERMGHHYIGTEHLLLGLLLEGEGVAAGVLGRFGVELWKTRNAVEQILGVEARS